MVALGALNPIEEVRAKLQDQIGIFLSSRAKLSRLMSNPSLQIRGQAQGLYAIQTAMETRLQNEILPKIQAVSTGVWNMSDIIALGGFTTQMMKQISDVNNLERAGGGVAVSAGLDIQTVAIGAVMLVAVSLLGGMLLKK
jgi:hypothetical protein